MNTFLSIFLWHCVQFVVCHRDFYIGMFKRNDYLVAQDVVYKEASHFGYTVASYGRMFKCPITYFRVIDRLGVGRGPITSVVRGGLRNNKIAVRIKSSYNLPVSVNIYVGCENKQPSTIKTLTRATLAETGATGDDGGGDGGGGGDAADGGGGDAADGGGGDAADGGGGDAADGGGGDAADGGGGDGGGGEDGAEPDGEAPAEGDEPAEDPAAPEE